jgi:hypothetical protein
MVDAAVSDYDSRSTGDSDDDVLTVDAVACKNRYPARGVPA